ncbi:protein kinase [Streptomyces sp. HUAS ZL42]|uniref:serine/threonine-protein kinase n=1 Tax=Streptomyces sp. HUAS ZL42 TaxID=3231715 RepID=UPI00345EB937
MEKLGPGDPQRIGGYRLLARLGAGGMGQVYLARSDRGRTVAVKQVRRELAAREEFRARFRQEVRNAQKVGGFWTAPVLDADTEADVPWVATGYVAGPSLQQVVGHDHGPLPERSVRILAAGLAHALTNIHAAGIVHRDLKPSNVMITIEGPRVIDFGIARALETVGDAGLTSTGAMIGSPGFMAPEQVRGERITSASDVFCLGSVLAYAATGTLPFGSTESGVHVLMFRIAEEEPDLRGVPEGIADLVRDCLRKDPATRPSLARILERTGAEDTVSGGRSRDPWLPSALVAQLGRHAVRLLDTEDPQGADGPQAGPAPEAAPEHAPVADGASVPGRAAAAPPPAVNHLPTVVAGPGGTQAAPPPGAPPGRAHAPASAPGHPAYGYPQQHPQPSAHGYPQQQPGAWHVPSGTPPSYNPYGDGPGSAPPPPPAGATAPYGPYGPAGPDDPEEPQRRSGRSTVLLVAVALIVALGAGGSVYALMNGDGSTQAGPTASPTVTTGPPTTPGPTAPEPSPTTSQPGSSAPADGAVPASYLGTWTTTIDNATGRNTRELTLTQGEVGDTVLTLVADGPTDNGTYHCEFAAELAEQPGTGGPLEIGPSKVTTGEPLSSCSPGAATEITLLSDGRLRRVNTDTGEKLTYTKE